VDAPYQPDILRVLCVDDNKDAADMLGALLEIAGFNPRVCYSGAQALAVLDEFNPDACILDIQMPGMDGVELAKRIRDWAGPRALPLVAVTGLDDDATRTRSSEVGFDLHLTKPADPDLLASLLADIVLLRGDWSDPGER